MSNLAKAVLGDVRCRHIEQSEFVPFINPPHVTMRLALSVSDNVNLWLGLCQSEHLSAYSSAGLTRKLTIELTAEANTRLLFQACNITTVLK